MYIGYYKAVNKAKEFYSEKRKNLDFPTQVEYMGEKYLLVSTHMATSKSQEDNIKKRAVKLDIPYSVKID